MFITADTSSIQIHPRGPRLDDALVRRFLHAPSPLVGDAMGRLGLMDSGIRPALAGARAVGTALTVLTREGDNLAIHCALDAAEPGDILVINALGGGSRAVFGDLLAEICVARGVVGVIIDGLARDADATSELGLPVWSRGSSPAGPFKHGPGAVGTPVACGQLVVRSGDLVVADSDGVAVVYPEIAAGVAERFGELEIAEAQLRTRIRASRVIKEERD